MRACLWLAGWLLRRADERAEAGVNVYAIDTSSAAARYAQELRRQGVGSLTLAARLKQQFLLPSLTRSHLVWEMFPAAVPDEITSGVGDVSRVSWRG